MDYENMEALPREKLLELVSIYAKNWLAMDGLWFQAAERQFGMDVAMDHDEEVWRRFTQIEANRIKAFLGLPDRAGLEGLEKALSFRLYACLNKDSIEIEGNTLLYRVHSCRVQDARSRKRMLFHPCKRVGVVEYDGFARVIDDRITAEAVSCYPDITDESCACVWKFTLKP
ncbi:DUF6125 family protein [Zongyangia hominis]|uniref:Uncharacterized protein n=1 Tax=Zongyangia hominis TaxID=2763677 RepID=A0A926I791_9FIRM|nr:DUF6125 family protein [Zongyangia hominis]MBC8570839.1 hypothetical protein [Zongyangia hominis]